MYDTVMRELVASYGQSTKDYFSIIHMMYNGGPDAKPKAGTIATEIILGGIVGGLTNGAVDAGVSDWSSDGAYGIMTANSKCLTLYLQEKPWIYTPENFSKVYAVDYADIFKVKFGWCFGKVLKIKFHIGDKKVKIDMHLFKSIKRIERQGEELVKLIEFFKALKADLKKGTTDHLQIATKYLNLPSFSLKNN